MAAPTPAQIKDRLVSICATITSVITAQDSWPAPNAPFTTAQLPAVVVDIGPATNQVVAGGLLSMDRAFQITVLAGRFDKDWDIRNNTTWELIEPFMLSVPQTFIRKPRLELNDSGLAVGITLPQERPMYALAFEGGLYAALPFTMQVRTRHS